MADCIYKNGVSGSSKEEILTNESAKREFSNIFVSDSGAVKVQEIIGDTVLLADNTEDAKKLLLKRSQYRYKGKMGFKDSEEEVIIEDQVIRVAEDNEYKRMYVHKLNMIPTGEQDDNGNYIYNVTAVFTMIDNPVWLVPALWALTAVGGTVGSWFLVDKIEEFSSTTGGSLVTIGLTVIGLILTYKSVYDG